MRDLGVRISLLTRIFFAAMTLVPSLATALVYGVGGYLAVNGHLSVGTLIALGTLLLRLLGPLQGLSNVRIDVMTALVSFDRVFEVLDLPSLIQEKPDAVALPRTAASRWSSTTSSFSYPRADEISLASLENVARTESRDSGEVLHDVASPPSPARWSRWSARPAPARPRSPTWSPGCTTRPPASSASAATTSAT